MTATAPTITQASAEQILERLTEMFPEVVERFVSKGGTRLTYIPVSEVITRMNNVIGINNWSSEVINVYRDALDPDFVIAHVRVTALIDGKTVIRDGVGGQPVKRTQVKKKDDGTKTGGGPVDLGDEFKGAVSDAFKKACQHFGVALYLARTEEAMEAETAGEQQPAPAPAPVDPRAEALFATLKTHLASMDDDTKGALKAHWMDKNPGERPPSAASPVDALEDAIMWCTEKAFS